jgi:hypothetical protein
MSYNRQYTPWIDDPDPPDRMTPEQSKAAAKKVAAGLAQRKRKPISDEELVQRILKERPGLTEEQVRRELRDFG